MPTKTRTFSLQCARDTLLIAAQTAVRAVSRSSPLPSLTYLLLDARTDGLTLTGTNLELAISARATSTVSGAGAALVPGRLFHEILVSLPNAPVALTQRETGAVTVACESVTFELPTGALDDFPQLPTEAGTDLATIDAQALQTILRQTVYAASTDETRPFLTGTYFQANDGVVEVAATDGGRLAIRRAAMASTQPFDAILPKRSVVELARLLGGISGPVTVSASETHVAFALPAVRLVTRRIAGAFPAYQHVVPAAPAHRITAATAALRNAVCRVGITARDSSHVVRLTVGEQVVDIGSNTPDVGSACERIAAEVSGSPITVAFNAVFLQEALDVIDTTETVLELTSPQSPAALRPVGGDDYVHVIAPVRVHA